RFGVSDRSLVESALARPRIAADYENADLLRQAATLCYGLVKNHPWVGGNKRTASVLVEYFLFLNSVELIVMTNDWIEMTLGVESGDWKIEEIENWMRRCARENIN
ncbi:MAG TPA: type II toxin-antitoxin system death-on-curing family toxin, partial [Pyrinomonadaceae bacterium]|nr:type II toxin-antitoxin system death-on-curing family toxin [Pyrinomonadaceae bacterium]